MEEGRVDTVSLHSKHGIERQNVMLTTWVAFLTLSDAMAKFGAFWLYAAISLAGWVFFYLRLPETRGRSMEQVVELFELSSCAPGLVVRAPRGGGGGGGGADDVLKGIGRGRWSSGSLTRSGASSGGSYSKLDNEDDLALGGGGGLGDGGGADALESGGQRSHPLRFGPAPGAAAEDHTSPETGATIHPFVGSPARPLPKS